MRPALLPKSTQNEGFSACAENAMKEAAAMQSAMAIDEFDFFIRYLPWIIL